MSFYSEGKTHLCCGRGWRKLRGNGKNDYSLAVNQDICIVNGIGSEGGRVPLWSLVRITLIKTCLRSSLEINVSKTKAVMFRPRGPSNELYGPFNFGSLNIEFVNGIKALGIVFSENMLWTNHVKYICAKLGKIVGNINKHRHIVPRSVRRVLYNSLFSSHLRYCNPVWGDTSLSNLNALHLL